MVWRSGDERKEAAARRRRCGIVVRSVRAGRPCGGVRSIVILVAFPRLSKDPGEELPGCPLVSNKVDPYITKII